MDTVEIFTLATALTVLAASIVAAGVVYYPGIRVATGDSMEPAISGPAIVHCNPGEFTAADIDEGDIVAVTPGNKEKFTGLDNESGTVMHRVTFIDDDVEPANIKTQGDNQRSSDGYSTIENVECLYQSHVELPG
jgi:signal peptidase I